MSVFLSPVGGAGAQFFDNSGNVLTGGKLYTYAAGTTTPQATYTSSAGSTFHANPIVLDAAGRVPSGGEIWLADSQIYKFVLKDSNDVLLATWDQLTGVNSNFVNYTAETELQTATSGQTVFTLTTMSYQPATGSLTVYVDGVNQYEGESYFETDSTTVTFVSGLHVGAEVKFTTAVQTTGNAVDASVVTYDPPFTGGVATTVEDKLAQTVSVKDFGAVGDGVADDTAAIEAAIAYATSVGIKQVNFGTGVFNISSAIALTASEMSFVGVPYSPSQSGSTKPPSYIVWTGGASPMFTCSASYIRFSGFGVENQGSATDWLELNSGSIGNIYEDLSFVNTATHTQFSRSVIRSNGNRVGYSMFKHLIVKTPALVFLDIDGQGTSNGITPISFSDRCIVQGGTSTPMTFIKITDEKIEGISISDCTFNASSQELVIFDSTASPVADVLSYFTFVDNEIDAVGTDNSAWRFFKFTNVRNIAINQNTFNCGGSKLYVADLVNSNVSSFYGNSYKSLATSFFNADADSTLKVGYQTRHTAYNQRPMFTPITGAILQYPWANNIIIDGTKLDPARHEIIWANIEVTSTTYQFRIDNSYPEFMTVGQVFTLVVRNVSGGTISAGTFGSTFRTTGVAVAPANGYSRSYTFFFDGTLAIEISRSVADVANS